MIIPSITIVVTNSIIVNPDAQRMDFVLLTEGTPSLPF
ncbi:hypothetical protein MGWOODY_Mmi1028 [hydrothermal vent metagenome]|uniref:Uncharacterized protein n=1 Tax=hydrothermal vent metagenome TaxID=652676 RepID=A0A160VGV5_9ZZZZ